MKSIVFGRRPRMAWLSAGFVLTLGVFIQGSNAWADAPNCVTHTPVILSAKPHNIGRKFKVPQGMTVQTLAHLGAYVWVRANGLQGYIEAAVLQRQCAVPAKVSTDDLPLEPLPPATQSLPPPAPSLPTFTLPPPSYLYQDPAPPVPAPPAPYTPATAVHSALDIPPEVPSTQVEVDTRPSELWQKSLWIAGSVSLAAAGVTFGITAHRAAGLSDSIAAYRASNPKLAADYASLQDRESQVHTGDTAAWVLGGVGLAALAGGSYLWLADSAGLSETAAASLRHLHWAMTPFGAVVTGDF